MEEFNIDIKDEPLPPPDEDGAASHDEDDTAGQQGSSLSNNTKASGDDERPGLTNISSEANQSKEVDVKPDINDINLQNYSKSNALNRTPEIINVEDLPEDYFADLIGLNVVDEWDEGQEEEEEAENAAAAAQQNDKKSSTPQESERERDERLRKERSERDTRRSDRSRSPLPRNSGVETRSSSKRQHSPSNKGTTDKRQKPDDPSPADTLLAAAKTFQSKQSATSESVTVKTEPRSPVVAEDEDTQPFPPEPAATPAPMAATAVIKQEPVEPGNTDMSARLRKELAQPSAAKPAAPAAATPSSTPAAAAAATPASTPASTSSSTSKSTTAPKNNTSKVPESKSNSSDQNRKKSKSKSPVDKQKNRRNKSKSPDRRRKPSRSPGRKKRRSKTPERRRRPSRSPERRRRPSKSPDRRRRSTTDRQRKSSKERSVELTGEPIVRKEHPLQVEKVPKYPTAKSVDSGKPAMKSLLDQPVYPPANFVMGEQPPPPGVDQVEFPYVGAPFPSSPVRRRSVSPRRRSPTPRRRSSSVRRRSPSPRRRSLSPIRRRRGSPSPRRRSPSPRRRISRSPRRRRSRSPVRRSRSPVRRSRSPSRRSRSPIRRSRSPIRRSYSRSPRRRSRSPGSYRRNSRSPGRNRHASNEEIFLARLRSRRKRQNRSGSPLSVSRSPTPRKRSPAGRRRSRDRSLSTDSWHRSKQWERERAVGPPTASTSTTPSYPYPSYSQAAPSPAQLPPQNFYAAQPVTAPGMDMSGAATYQQQQPYYPGAGYNYPPPAYDQPLPPMQQPPALPTTFSQTVNTYPPTMMTVPQHPLPVPLPVVTYPNVVPAPPAPKPVPPPMFPQVTPPAKLGAAPAAASAASTAFPNQKSPQKKTPPQKKNCPIKINIQQPSKPAIPGRPSLRPVSLSKLKAPPAAQVPPTQQPPVPASEMYEIDSESSDDESIVGEEMSLSSFLQATMAARAAGKTAPFKQYVADRVEKTIKNLEADATVMQPFRFVVRPHPPRQDAVRPPHSTTHPSLLLKAGVLRLNCAIRPINTRAVEVPEQPQFTPAVKPPPKSILKQPTVKATVSIGVNTDPEPVKLPPKCLDCFVRNSKDYMNRWTQTLPPIRHSAFIQAGEDLQSFHNPATYRSTGRHSAATSTVSTGTVNRFQNRLAPPREVMFIDNPPAANGEFRDAPRYSSSRQPSLPPSPPRPEPSFSRASGESSTSSFRRNGPSSFRDDLTVRPLRERERNRRRSPRRSPERYPERRRSADRRRGRRGRYLDDGEFEEEEEEFSPAHPAEYEDLDAPPPEEPPRRRDIRSRLEPREGDVRFVRYLEP